jgi:uncharacterized protein (TIGR02301 family)
MLLRPLALALLSGAALLAAPARAQEQPSNPDHWASVMELAGTLGQAHWIRILCNGDQDETWRTYMQDLMQVEAHSGSDRAQLVDAFNRGFRSLRPQYKECSPAMKQVEAQLAARGKAMSDKIARSYLNR